jgi:hypothetical protein
MCGGGVTAGDGPRFITNEVDGFWGPGMLMVTWE